MSLNFCITESPTSSGPPWLQSHHAISSSLETPGSYSPNKYFTRKITLKVIRNIKSKSPLIHSFKSLDSSISNFLRKYEVYSLACPLKTMIQIGLRNTTYCLHSNTHLAFPSLITLAFHSTNDYWVAQIISENAHIFMGKAKFSEFP